jgi:hypothetical protein
MWFERKLRDRPPSGIAKFNFVGAVRPIEDVHDRTRGAPRQTVIGQVTDELNDIILVHGGLFTGRTP